MNQYRIEIGRQGDLAPWQTIELSDLSLAAGIAAALIPILLQLNNPEDNIITVDGVEEEEDETALPVYLWRANFDLNLFRVIEDYQAMYVEGSSVGKLEPNQYGLWLKGGQFYRYSLYRFRSAAFIQGVISICQHFGVDFRNYFYGVPFDAEGNKYVLDGYLMQHNYVAQLVPDDLEDEAEDWDNENLINPYLSMETSVDWEQMDDIPVDNPDTWDQNDWSTETTFA